METRAVHVPHGEVLMRATEINDVASRAAQKNMSRYTSCGGRGYQPLGGYHPISPT